MVDESFVSTHAEQCVRDAAPGPEDQGDSRDGGFRRDDESREDGEDDRPDCHGPFAIEIGTQKVLWHGGFPFAEPKLRTLPTRQFRTRRPTPAGVRGPGLAHLTRG